MHTWLVKSLHVINIIIDGTDREIDGVHAVYFHPEDLHVEGEVGEGDGPHCDVVADWYQRPGGVRGEPEVQLAHEHPREYCEVGFVEILGEVVETGVGLFGVER